MGKHSILWISVCIVSSFTLAMLWSQVTESSYPRPRSQHPMDSEYRKLPDEVNIDAGFIKKLRALLDCNTTLPVNLSLTLYDRWTLAMAFLRETGALGQIFLGSRKFSAFTGGSQSPAGNRKWKSSLYINSQSRLDGNLSRHALAGCETNSAIDKSNDLALHCIAHKITKKIKSVDSIWDLAVALIE